jgi:hypothetical protein
MLQPLEPRNTSDYLTFVHLQQPTIIDKTLLRVSLVETYELAKQLDIEVEILIFIGSTTFCA